MADCCVCGKRLGLLSGGTKIPNAAGAVTDKKVCFDCFDKARKSGLRLVYDDKTGTVATESIRKPASRKEKQDIIDFIEKTNSDHSAAADKGIDAIVDLLQPNEQVIYAFGAVKVERKNASDLMFCTIVMTNTRLIISGDIGTISTGFIASTYDVSMISSVTVSAVGIDMAYIVIELIGNDDVRIQMVRKNAIEINNELVRCINEVKKAVQNNHSSAMGATSSVADEIKKFKELLDMGMITQEEFDAKKKQLLGL